MRLRRMWSVLGLVLLAGATAWGEEVSLEKLTTKLIRDRVRENLVKEGPKEVLDDAGVTVTFDPEWLSYSYSKGTPKIDCTIPASANVSEDQRVKIQKALRGLLTETLHQIESLVNEPDMEKLNNNLGAVTIETPPPSSPIPSGSLPPPPADNSPTLGPIADVSLEWPSASGKANLVISDENAATVTVTATSSNPAVLSDGGLTVTGEGKARTLTIKPVEGASGNSTVTVTLTDEKGKIASRRFTLKVLANVSQSPSVIGVPKVEIVNPSSQTPMSLSFVAPAPSFTVSPSATMVVSYVPVVNQSGCWFSRRTCYVTYEMILTPSPECVCAPATPSPKVVYPSGQALMATTDYAVVRTVEHVPMADSVPSTLAVSRAALIKGKKAEDDESLLNRGLEEYWAGRYSEAAEYCAAAAYLGDSPVAWTYLSLSSLMLGDMRTARDAARYSAARVQAEPSYGRSVAYSLVRIQGPLRSEFTRLQEGVDQRKVVSTILAARPRLISPQTSVASKATANGVAARTTAARGNR